MRLLAIVLAVPALLVGWLWWSDHSLEKKLQPVATAIAGREVKVDCQSFWGGLLDAQGREGEVRFDAAGTPGAEAVHDPQHLRPAAALCRALAPRCARLPHADRLAKQRPAPVRVILLRERREDDLLRARARPRELPHRRRHRRGRSELLR